MGRSCRLDLLGFRRQAKPSVDLADDPKTIDRHRSSKTSGIPDFHMDAFADATLTLLNQRATFAGVRIRRSEFAETPRSDPLA